MTTEKIQTIQSNATYKAVLEDSFGGCIYNEANRKKYSAINVQWIISAWDAMPEGEQNAAGGIMKGAISFLKGE